VTQYTDTISKLKAANLSLRGSAEESLKKSGVPAQPQRQKKLFRRDAVAGVASAGKLPWWWWW